MSKFEDPDFPATDAALYRNPARPDKAPNFIAPRCKWLRPHQICKDPSLFPKNVAPNVKQGALGACWFLSALSVIANRPRILARLFKNNPTGMDINPMGKYVISFYYDQVWTDVTIDDRIPCYENGKVAFSGAKKENCFWVPLIEKAYAKLHGKCYEHLEGGVASAGLANLVGFVGVKIYFEDRFKLLTVSEDQSRMLTDGQHGLLDPNNPKDVAAFHDWLWAQFSIASAFRCVFATGKSDDDSGIEEATPDGLLCNHAYGVLKFMEIKGVRLVKLRNPWGKVEWNGKWSDKSSAWNDEMKKLAGWKDEDDGIFHMEWADFIKEFPAIFQQGVELTDDDLEDVAEMMDENATLRKFIERKGGKDEFMKRGAPKMVSFDFRLEGEASGGCLNYATWRNNPQIIIKTPPGKKLNCNIQVVQKDMRYTGDAEYKEALGFMILKGSDLTIGKHPKSLIRCTSLGAKSDIVYKSPIEYARYVTANVTLEPYDGAYFLVGYMFNPTDDTDKLRINVIPMTTKKGQTVVFPVERDYAYKITDELAGPRAGGCPNFPTWVNNPQYVIQPVFGSANLSLMMVPGTAKVSLSKIKPASLAIGVFDDADQNGKVREWGTLVSDQPTYAGAQQLVVKVSIKDGQYIIMPHSYKPEYQFPFELYIYSSTPLKLAQVRKGEELYLTPKSRERSKALQAAQVFADKLKEKHNTRPKLQTALKRLFADHDKSGDGCFTLDDFKRAMKSITGGTLDDGTVAVLFDMIDTDGTGMMDSGEFMTAVTNLTYPVK
jgi:hypothetical protein